MVSETEYKIALSLIPGMTADVVRTIFECGITFKEFFSLNMPELSDRLGLEVKVRYQNVNREEALFRARQELAFITRHSIRVLFLMDDDYPILLREIQDAPIVIYVLGEADLNSFPAIGLVGTRRCTAYGTNFCNSFIKDISPYFPNAMIVSGLAYGIDSASHSAALEHGLNTIGVLAHGLDTIYPAANRHLAKEIIRQGGALVSEYPSGTRPFQKNFLQRNRIVAGLCETTIVVESEIRGGAMSTANQAFSYSREVFAVPGRYNDLKSAGCNALIERNKASIFTSVPDFMNYMNWEIPAIGVPAPPKQLFPELEGNPAKVYQIIFNSSDPVQIDEIHTKTGLSMPTLMATLTDLEFDGVITKLPGSRYSKC